MTLPTFTDLIDLAAERLGGSVLLANDEFFAEKENLLKPTKPVWREGVYNERGKWMDGWETRRRRDAGYDWCIIRLGAPGIVRGVVVDTTFFTGNYPEECSIEASSVPGVPDPQQLADRADWKPLLPRSPLRGDTQNYFTVSSTDRVTHLRLNIFPDGGVARLRVHGEVVPDWNRLQGREIDLAAMENGARVIVCSDMFYGHRQNLILPGPSINMGDGWETKRRRGPGHDWTVVQLAGAGGIRRVEVDTSHFKGNSPGSCSLEVIDSPRVSVEQLSAFPGEWRPLMAQAKLQPNTRHLFENELRTTARATHVRLNIFPDGGVARLRVFGTLAAKLEILT
jgi:allantoicase